MIITTMLCTSLAEKQYSTDLPTLLVVTLSAAITSFYFEGHCWPGFYSGSHQQPQSTQPLNESILHRASQQEAKHHEKTNKLVVAIYKYKENFVILQAIGIIYKL